MVTCLPSFNLMGTLQLTDSKREACTDLSLMSPTAAANLALHDRTTLQCTVLPMCGCRAGWPILTQRVQQLRLAHAAVADEDACAFCFRV